MDNKNEGNRNEMIKFVCSFYNLFVFAFRKSKFLVVDCRFDDSQ